MKRALLLGCGSSRERKVSIGDDRATDFTDFDLVTVDMNPDCNPTYVCMLPELPPNLGTFDEIHAYDSLEHWGIQGDWKGWIDEMERYHDLLNPGGRFFTLVPAGEDRFTDCGHVRFFGENYFTILSNAWYEQQAAKGNHVGDYRWYRKKDFNILALQYFGEPAHHIAAVLERADG